MELKDKDSIDRYKDIKGIMTNVMCLLFSLGWDPKMFNLWEDMNSDIWKIDYTTETPKMIIKMLIDTKLDNDHSRACQHYAANGIQNGIDWESTMCLLRSKKVSYQQKCCLLYTSPSPRDGLLSRMPSSA